MVDGITVDQYIWFDKILEALYQRNPLSPTIDDFRTFEWVGGVKNLGLVFDKSEKLLVY
jgi:hypothetical protein